MATSKKSKRLLNAVMVATAVVVVVAGVMAVSALKSPASSQSEAEGGVAVIAEDKLGNVNVVRSGVGYSLDDSSVLMKGDLVETLSSSSITLAAAGVGSVTLSEDTAITVTSSDAAARALLVITAGEAYATAEPAGEFALATAQGEVVFSEGTIALVSARAGAATVQVLAGSAEAAGIVAEAGQSLSLVEGEDGNVSAETTKLVVESLSDFAISRAQGAIQDGATLCFGADELDALEADRAEERESSQAAASGGASLAIDGGSGTAPAAGSGRSDSAADPSGSDPAMTCTIQIRCDAILDNMESLTAGKDIYVPTNGVILATSTVRIGEGDTVFDVLKAACSAAGIPLEYSYTPMYESYYIEGINNLYEFDCGSQSGWNYKVNGWFPNYGCSNYTLEDGDVIVWCYTCNGLGADVGASI